MKFNRKGQSVLPEYVVAFFLAVAAIVTMTTFVQRAFQARIRDTKNYMVRLAQKECDDNCQKAIAANDEASRSAAVTSADDGDSGPKKNIPYEYEPYYGQVDSKTSRDLEQRTGLLKGLQTGEFRKATSETSQTTSRSEQLPPDKAN